MIIKFSILNRARYFSSGLFQNYLVFIPAKKHIKYFATTTQIESFKSNGMSDKSIEKITKSDSNFVPTFVDHSLLPERSFNRYCSLTSNISTPKKVINLYTSYTQCPQLVSSNTDFTISNCLIGSVKLTKNADPNKYNYTCYGIGFVSMEKISLFLELI